MPFADDTEVALVSAAALVNTVTNDGDTLRTRAGLDDYLERYEISGTVLGTDEELASVRRLRIRLRELWEVADRDEAAAKVNAILDDAGAHPYLAKHDHLDWHLHVTRPDAPLANRLGAEAAMGVLDLIRTDSLDRLRICEADDCDDVLVDLSKNRSRRYCDGSCGNKAAVAAYRARKRSQAS